MKKNNALLLAVAGTLLFPSFAAAQGGAVSGITSGFTNLGTVVNSFNTTIVSGLSTLFMSLAVLGFIWGLVQYIWGAREGKEEQIKKGNMFMMYALLALFVMFSVWGIIKLFQGVLFPGQNLDNINIPRLQVGGSSGGVGGHPMTGTCTGLGQSACVQAESRGCLWNYTDSRCEG